MHVNKRAVSNLLLEFLLICLVLLWFGRAAAETNSATGTNLAAGTNAAVDQEGRAAEAVVIGTQENLRSSLQIQEELHNTQIAIEKNRKDSEAESKRNAELLEARLSLIEKSITAQQMDELKRLQNSNHMILLAAGAFAIVGFIVLLFAAFVQWTAVNRLTALSARLPRSLTAGSAPAALEMPEAALLPAGGEQTTVQLLGVIEKLEKRIEGIEKAGPSAEHGSSNGSAGPLLPPSSPALEAIGSVALLMGKGQTLLKLDKPEEAIACFDEALAIEPGNTDVLVRKGAALERLQKMDEAIVCYDQAIAADSSMTMAYLYKGGVYNRLERYSEALECYEQALKTQQKGPAANVIIEN